MGVSVFPAAGGGVTQKVTEFTSSGTFTLPSGFGAGNPLVATVIIGGGGGGGGGGGASDSGTGGGGGGGGSGIVAQHILSLTANVTVTIGAGGNGGNGATHNASNNGSAGAAGGITTFGDISTPGGRGGGQGSNSSNQSAPSTGNLTLLGYMIRGGTGFNTLSGFGAAGGSGGGAGNNSGGSYGHGSTVDGISYSNNGCGLSDMSYFGYNQNPNFTSNAYSHDTLQRGAGAGGYQVSSNGNWGNGGNAGGFVGGVVRTSFNQVFADATGRTATVPSAGGGGGGGSTGNMGANPTAGPGGAGAAGFVRVIYWS